MANLLLLINTTWNVDCIRIIKPTVYDTALRSLEHVALYPCRVLLEAEQKGCAWCACTPSEITRDSQSETYGSRTRAVVNPIIHSATMHSNSRIAEILPADESRHAFYALFFGSLFFALHIAERSTVRLYICVRVHLCVILT